MCQTGGPRCDTRVRERLTAAEGALEQSLIVLGGAWERHEAEAVAWEAEYDEEYRDSDDDNLVQARWQAAIAKGDLAAAYGEMCATRSGEEHVRALAAENQVAADALENALKEGAYYRRRGTITRAIRAREDSDDVTGVLGLTGDTVTDTLILEAAREFAANWGDHGPVTDVPAVKHYTSEAQKARGVRRWQGKVQDQAQRMRQAKQRLDRAQEDLAAAQAQATSSDPNGPDRVAVCQTYLDDAQRELRAARTSLVVHADKLRIAEQREVPSDG